MKFRTDYVTNSSSSSYICVAKIDKNEELLNYFRDEYGKYGLRLLDEYLVAGKEIKNSDNYDYEEFNDYLNDSDIQISDNDMFLQASFVSWSTEGDDAWLYQHIPCKYKEEIYEGSCD